MHPLAEGDHDDQVGLQRADLLHRLGGAHPVRLQHRDAVQFRQLLHRRGHGLLSASLRAIRLGDGGDHVLATVDELLQGGAGELGGPHEDDTHTGHGSRP
jgi:hypothetical protein